MTNTETTWNYQRVATRFFLLAQLLMAPYAVTVAATVATTGEGLIFPEPGTTLTDTRQTFNWQLDSIDESWLYVGTSTGSNDIHNSGNLGSASSANIAALPNDGQTIYLRLFFRSAGMAWQHLDYSFQAHSGASAIDMLSPANGSTLSATRQWFNWRGEGIDEWWIHIGSGVGRSDIHNSGNLGSTTTTEITALPHDGRTVYMRLLYRQSGAAWQHRDFTFVSHTGARAIDLLSPIPGSTIADSSQTFTWQGAGIDEWWLYVGTTEGNNNIYNSGNLGSATSATVALKETGTSTQYVRLFYRQHGASWRHIDFSYNLTKQLEQNSDLIALHYDVAPDLDDLHAIAAGANLSDKYGISPAVVIGAYGLVGRGGPPDNDLKYLYDTATNTLGQGPDIGETRQTKARKVTSAAYGADSFLDTGYGWNEAVNAQANKFWNSLQGGFAVSVADGGPMDFTADVLRRLQSFHGATAEQLKRVLVVQHSLGFNVSNTLPVNRAAVSNLATYITIDNGNVGGNATANLEDSNTNTTNSNFALWARNSNTKADAWNSALNDFSAKVDFSDTVEYLYILGIPLSSVSDINSFSNFFN